MRLDVPADLLSTLRHQLDWHLADRLGDNARAWLSVTR